MASMTYCSSLVTITVSSGKRSRNGILSFALLDISGTMVTLSSISFDNWLSTSNERRVSISSSKKSIRYGCSLEKE